MSERCPRPGCSHIRGIHALEPHGPHNRFERSGSCGSVSCECRAWDDSRAHAQAAYVRAWREQHPDEVYTTPTMCPLCNCALQSNGGGFYRLVEDHTDTHGEDWQAYERIGQEGT